MIGFLHSSTPSGCDCLYNMKPVKIPTGFGEGSQEALGSLGAAQKKKGSCPQGYGNLSVTHASVDGPAPMYIQAVLMDSVG